jgi:hypothetical protein
VSEISPEAYRNMREWLAAHSEPPTEVRPLLLTLERLSQDEARRTIEAMALDTGPESILHWQQQAMNAIQANLIRTRRSGLAPVASVTADSALAALLAALPTTPEQVKEVEQAAAEVLAEQPELVADLADMVPRSVQRPSVWAVFISVACVLPAIAPELPANDVGMLAVIVVVAAEIWKRLGAGGD